MNVLFFNRVIGFFDKTDKNKPNNNQCLYILNKDIVPWQFNNSDVQIDIDADGNIKMTGYPTNKLIDIIKRENNARV